MKNSAFYGPVYVCGVVAGVFGAVPCLQFLNCCFGGWSILGALIAVKLVSDKVGTSIDMGEGLVVGLIVGGIAGLIGGAGTALIQIAMHSVTEGLAGVAPPIDDPQVREMYQRILGSGAGIAVSSFCMWFGMSLVGGPIGGLIGAAAFKK
jgi:hypothetical protein